jgi:TPR repeat protein
VLKWQQLTGPNGPVVARSPDKSNLYDYIASGEMPPEDDKRVKVRPTENEISIIRKWILAGAPSFEELVKRDFISPEKMRGFIQADLRDKVAQLDRQYMRYFTLTHLYNAGIRDDEIETYRLAISKLINSLSWSLEIVRPQSIDPKKTIYRIDLRDYDWDIREDGTSSSVWDAIIAQSPYNDDVEYNREATDYLLRKQTGHKIPYVRGDWFVAAASRPPLYHQILEIPQTAKELENRLGVSVAANITREVVVRAGFTRSGVSQNNRMIERHQSQYGAYWKSYDFAGNKGQQLLTRHPLGPGKNETYFKHDGGEIIFNLPNGLQAYMLIEASGKRISKGPTSIVSEPDDVARDGNAVVNGISCMHCHDQGIKRKDDEIRPYVEANPIVFRDQPGLADSIKALYPEKAVIDRLFDQDARRHIQAAGKAGSPVTEDEETGQLKLVDRQPIVRLSTQFHNELDLKLASAEAGVPPDDLINLLSNSKTLAAQIGILRIPGKTIKRGTYVAAFTSIIGELRIVRRPAEIKRLRESAEQGNAISQFLLAQAYLNGDGVAKNFEETVKWYRKSADQGLLVSQNNLALQYLNGEGVAKNVAEAAKWWRKAAERGYVSSQHSLGLVYKVGTVKGIPKDYGEAAKWFTKAAEQGYAKSQFEIGVAYYNGQGVPETQVYAYAWFILAAEQGEVDARAALKIATQMTAKEIAEAKGLSSRLAAKIAEQKAQQAFR